MSETVEVNTQKASVFLRLLHGLFPTACRCQRPASDRTGRSLLYCTNAVSALINVRVVSMALRSLICPFTPSGGFVRHHSHAFKQLTTHHRPSRPLLVPAALRRPPIQHILMPPRNPPCLRPHPLSHCSICSLRTLST